VDKQNPKTPFHSYDFQEKYLPEFITILDLGLMKSEEQWHKDNTYIPFRLCPKKLQHALACQGP